MSNLNEFKAELTNLINKHSLENLSDTPDFILAEFLVNQLILFGVTTETREAWYGRSNNQMFETADVEHPAGGPVPTD